MEMDAMPWLQLSCAPPPMHTSNGALYGGTQADLPSLLASACITLQPSEVASGQSAPVLSLGSSVEARASAASPDLSFFMHLLTFWCYKMVQIIFSTLRPCPGMNLSSRE